ncbi:MAG: 50S ribosomal protein L13 [Candidatus Omnitrophica bacterium]|nr:50S ribosomal protein L13 [Candidatus Omnitrophota bacterium]
MKTYNAKDNQVEHKCYIVDAKDKILGRVAARVAAVLRGKHKPTYTPHVDTGDTVIIINAEKIRVTGKKLTDKVYERYTGYPSGKREVALGDMLKKRPETVLRLAVERMIPSGPLGSKVLKKLRVYAGDKHPHSAQNPVVLQLK